MTAIGGGCSEAVLESESHVEKVDSAGESGVAYCYETIVPLVGEPGAKGIRRGRGGSNVDYDSTEGG